MAGRDSQYLGKVKRIFLPSAGQNGLGCKDKFRTQPVVTSCSLFIFAWTLLAGFLPVSKGIRLNHLSGCSSLPGPGVSQTAPHSAGRISAVSKCQVLRAKTSSRSWCCTRQEPSDTRCSITRLTSSCPRPTAFRHVPPLSARPTRHIPRPVPVGFQTVHSVRPRPRPIMNCEKPGNTFRHRCSAG
jgi:hypothetical protein